jgi:hypothetical protein
MIRTIRKGMDSEKALSNVNLDFVSRLRYVQKYTVYPTRSANVAVKIMTAALTNALPVDCLLGLAVGLRIVPPAIDSTIATVKSNCVRSRSLRSSGLSPKPILLL